MLLAALIVALVGVVFILLTTFFGVRSLMLLQRGHPVEGQVVDLLRVSDSDGADTYLPIFAYPWQGQTLSKKAGFSSNPPRYKVGDRIQMLVDPANPQDAVPKRFMDLWFMPLFFGAMAGLMFVIAVVILVTG